MYRRMHWKLPQLADQKWSAFFLFKTFTFYFGIFGVYLSNKNNNMRFLSNIIKATVKTVLTPIAVVKDVANIATDKKPKATSNLIDEIAKDVKKSYY